ncbi:hypothetical protein BGM26_00650 [Bacillus sp. FJAT-29790]|uniref:hypothetical protein n=1 Tax=Bacillus sp. FJAT-29790 TaxID=1895002 RepID=UPI001C22338B|nr:hypothetical protein [Bacillus sp. FJAT-29790]MBU8877496.1 hypothetical protein [Bacillus sp. FJAT-29790]
MGYIAPITNYQYNQYAEREIGNVYDPYRFVPVSRIKPSINPPKEEQPNLLLNLGRPINSKKGINRDNRNNRNQIEKLYSEITGKGCNYNECI